MVKRCEEFEGSINLYVHPFKKGLSFSFCFLFSLQASSFLLINVKITYIIC